MPPNFKIGDISMKKDITTILRKYENIGLCIELEFISCGDVEGLMIRGRLCDKDENYYFYSQIYPISIIIEVFHADIEAILCDFKIRFESERRKRGMI